MAYYMIGIGYSDKKVTIRNDVFLLFLLNYMGKPEMCE